MHSTQLPVASHSLQLAGQAVQLPPPSSRKPSEHMSQLARLPLHHRQLATVHGGHACVAGSSTVFAHSRQAPGPLQARQPLPQGLLQVAARGGGQKGNRWRVGRRATRVAGVAQQPLVNEMACPRLA